MTVNRYDFGEFASPRKLDNGYLRCDARITRVGVFTYLNADGTTRKELRLPEEVFNSDSLESFQDMPLTNDHPREPLTSKNTRKYQVGHVNQVRKQDQFVAAAVVMTDDDTISAAENGKTQLSCGYKCDLDFTPGVTKGVDGMPDGIQYDAVQRNIRGNHVALVDQGRAGSEASLHLDANDAVMINGSGEGTKPNGRQTPTPREVPMKTIKIDGVDYELSEQAAQAVGKVMARNDELVTASETHTAELAEQTARADKAEEALEEQKKLNEDALSPEKVQTAIKARVALERTAEKILKSDEELKLDAMSDDEIRRAVVLAVSPKAEEKLDAGDEAYLAARFDQAVESFKEDDNTPAPTNPDLNKLRNPSSDDRVDAVSAREKMLKSHQEMGRAPLSQRAPASN